jgi:DNA-binding transcriptional LysR family regulator
MNLNDLHAFVQVVDHGGFTAAGRALRVPKQTLSKRVGELERQAGVRLIQRTSRRFAVTEVGRELYRHAAAMVVEAEAASSVIAGRLAEPSGTVRITASMPAVQVRLAPLMPRIARAFPKIRIVLHADDRFVDVVQEGYDLALRTHSAPLPDSDLVQRRLNVDEFWLIASPDCFRDRVPATLEDLRAVPLISAVEDETVWSLTNPAGELRSVALRASFVSNEGSAMLEATCAGLGIAALPASLCAEHVRSGRLIRICADWTAGALTTTLLMPSRRGLLPSVRAVADMIVEELADRSAAASGPRREWTV